MFIDSEPNTRTPAAADMVITDPGVDRYSSLGLISWWRQDVVRNATAMVLGAGALGNEVIKNLALMGMGRIVIVDFDKIEMSNLSRSVLFRAYERGLSKAQVAAQAALELNADVAVRWLDVDINHELGLGVYRRMDIVIACLDNREARLSVNRACWHIGKPWIDGAIQELLGVARVFRPGMGACYECTLTDEDYRIIRARQSCTSLAQRDEVEGRVPTTPTISSIVAGIQTQEALKLLHGLPVSSGKALVFNGLQNDVFLLEYPEKQDCLSHEIYDQIIELKEASAYLTTVRELLDIAQEILGDDAMLQIPPFVEKAICEGCGVELTLHSPRYRLTEEDARCKRCGDLMEMITHERVKGDESFLDLTLLQIGIPPLDVVAVVTRDWRSVYLELTGDVDTVLHYIQDTPEMRSDLYQRRGTWKTRPE